MNVGDKLMIKDYDALGEIIGFMPGGQGRITEDTYSVMFNGVKITLLGSVLDMFFRKIEEPKKEPKVVPIKKVESLVEEVKEVSEPVKKTKSKKKTKS